MSFSKNKFEKINDITVLAFQQFIAQICFFLRFADGVFGYKIVFAIGFESNSPIPTCFFLSLSFTHTHTHTHTCTQTHIHTYTYTHTHTHITTYTHTLWHVQIIGENWKVFANWPHQVKQRNLSMLECCLQLTIQTN